MSIVKNKAVVRRFIKEVLSRGNTDLLDELLAPNYVNPSMGVTGRAGFKAAVSGLKAAVPTRDFKIEDLMAEGNSVVFRGTLNGTTPGGKKVTARVLTYYRLSNGKIVEDEPLSSPDLGQLMGGVMPKPSGS